MFSADSPLRRVPAILEPKQALFIDGIRHAVEIMELGYHRLRETLTNIALDPPTSIELQKLSSHVFLDAWAIVDAIDRFRMLYLQMPGISFEPQQPGVETLATVTQPFRNLRNVADHLSQRAEFVVARGGAALGTLTWITGFQLDPPKIWFCTLRPGTLRAIPEFRTEPLHSTIDWPTDRICLNAGGYEGNFSTVRPHIERRVKHFESQIGEAFALAGVSDSPTANDVFSRQPYQLAPGQFPWQE